MDDYDNHENEAQSERSDDAQHQQANHVEEQHITAHDSRTVLTKGQSRKLLQSVRFDDPQGLAALMKPLCEVKYLNVESDNGFVSAPPCDGFWDNEAVNDQRPTIVTRRGHPLLAKYPPLVKSNLSTDDVARVFDTVLLTGDASNMMRNQINMIGAKVVYPGTCANENTPIITDFKSPLPPLPKTHVDLPRQMAIVAWATSSDPTKPIAPLVMKPLSSSFAIVRCVQCTIGDLLAEMRRRLEKVTNIVTEKEKALASDPNARYELASAERAKTNLNTLIASIQARTLHFVDGSARTDDSKRCSDASHLQRVVRTYVYDDVPEWRATEPTGLLALFRPSIPGFEREREAHAVRCWKADKPGYEAIGISVDTFGTIDGKCPRVSALYVMPQVMITPMITSINAEASGIKLDLLPPPDSCGDCDSDVAQIIVDYQKNLKTLTANPLQTPKPAPPAETKQSTNTSTVVMPAPTKEAMSTTTVAATMKNFERWTSLVTEGLPENGKVTGKSANAAKRRAPKRKQDAENAEQNGASKETTTEEAVAKKPKVDEKEVPVAEAPRVVAPPTVVAEHTLLPVSTKTAELVPSASASSTFAQSDGWYPTKQEDGLGLDSKLLTVQARLCARGKRLLPVAVSGQIGKGPVGLVKQTDTALTVSQRQQLFAAYQFAGFLGIAPQFHALVEEASANAERQEQSRREAEDAERKRQAEEEERKRREAEEAERKRKAEEAERKRQAEEAERKRQAEEAERKRQAEEAERKRQAEEAERKRQDEAQKAAAATSAMAVDDEDEEAAMLRQLEELRKRKAQKAATSAPVAVPVSEIPKVANDQIPTEAFE